MSDELTIWGKVFLVIAGVIGIGQGGQEWWRRNHIREHSDLTKRLNKLAEAIPANYRDKEECREICGRIEKSVGKMETSNERNTQRLFDKLDGKEDKHP